MAKFRARGTVEAEQWFPGKHIPGVVLFQPPDVVIGGRGYGEMRFTPDPYHAVLLHRDGKQVALRVEPGDWIVSAPGDQVIPCKPDVFAAKFEPAT